MGATVVSIFEVGDYDAQITRAVELLTSGGIVVLPTETVYGAAGVLSNSAALDRLKALRGGEAKPFIVHLARRADAARYLGTVTEYAQRLMTKLWPGPVALTFDVPAEAREQVAKRLGVAESDLYDNGSITLRCPDHIVATDVIGRIPAPIVVTAASQPAQAAKNENIDFILDAGPTKFSRPSTILHVKSDGGYEIVRAGVYDERIIERLLRTTILFVCSGNTCRSPMAEAITRRVLAEQLHVTEDELEQKGIIVLSAGSFAMPGTRAAAPAIEALKGVSDLTRHRSRPLTVELIHQADVIFTMSRNHNAAVTALVPSAAEKTTTLDPAGDIDDPIGGDTALYQKLAVELRTLVEKRLAEKIPVLI
jgi:protein-tyrosine phosphatase